MQNKRECVLLKPVADSEFAEKVAGCETSYDILRLARELTKTYGFDYFSIMRLPNSEDRQLSAIAIVSN
jgi:LuxR family transcriptional regulator, quorum-sensing system regulator BjaR1